MEQQKLPDSFWEKAPQESWSNYLASVQWKITDEAAIDYLVGAISLEMNVQDISGLYNVREEAEDWLAEWEGESGEIEADESPDPSPEIFGKEPEE